MSSPKFNVGELITLQSLNYPQYNGQEFEVLGVISGEEYGVRYNCQSNGDFCYELSCEVILQFINGINSDFVCNHWSESSLRKKYPPSSQSFKEIMSELKSVSPRINV